MILCLDFDGVTWDSARECFHVALEAHHRALGPGEGNVERFLAGRWLARTCGDFLPLLRLSATSLELSRENFSASSRQGEEAFVEAFYAERGRLQREQPDTWLSWQRPQPWVLSQWAEVTGLFSQVKLLTTRDEASARQLLATVGVDIPILDRYRSEDKGALVGSLGVPPHQVLLLDDLLDNLLTVQQAGARAALAGWGYNNASEWERAARHSIPVLQQEQLARQLERR